MQDNQKNEGFVPDDPIISSQKTNKIHQAMQDLKQDFTHLTEKENEQAHIGAAQAIEEVVYPADELNPPHTAKPKASEEMVYPKVELNRKPKPQEQEQENKTETLRTSTKNRRFSPENWKVLGFLPPKSRRFFVILFAVLLVGVVLYLLRPTSQPVHSFDPSQPALTNKPNAKPENSFVTLQDLTGEQNSVEFTQANTAGNLDQTTNNVPNQFAQTNQAIAQPNVDNNLSSDTLPLAGENPTLPANESSPAALPDTTPSLPSTTEIKQTSQQVQADVFSAAEQANLLQAPAPKTSAKKQEMQTLTIRKGQSLMQVFRNHHLKIADVTAMNKVNSRALSRFRAGDNINIWLNAQGHVQKMQLPNGASFIRYGNSYRYQQ